MKITSNYLGQLLLGLGAAILAALFAVLRDLLHHWRTWHLPVIAVCLLLLFFVIRIHRTTQTSSLKRKQ